jgi:hypothetical protein
MAIPKWAQQHLQQKVNEGSLNYDDLGETARGQIKKPVTKAPEKPLGVLPSQGMGDIRATERIMPEPPKLELKPPARSLPQQLYRALDINLDNALKGATAGFLGKGGGLERGISKLTGGKFKPFTPTQPETTAEKALAIGSDLGGAGLPISRGIKFAKAALPAGKGLIPKLIPASVSVGGYEGIRGINEGDSPEEVAKRAALGAALGGGGELLFRGVGRAAQALRPTPRPIPPGADVLSLPQPPPKLPPAQEMALRPAVNGPDLTRAVRSGAKNLSVPRLKVAVDSFSGPKKVPIPRRIGLAQNPQNIEAMPGSQKPRQFPLSIAKSEAATPELAEGVLKETAPGGRGAYDPITLRGADAEAKRFVDSNAEGAYRYIINEREPSALHTATGIRLIERFQNEGNFERAIDVSMSLAEKLTKQGQAISAARIMGALRPDGVLVFAQRQINKINRDKAFNTKDLQLTPEMAKTLKDLAQRVQDAADDAARLEASQELQAALNSLKPSGIGRKIATGQTIAQLLNPKTIIRNIGGNELFYRLERLNKYVATPIDWARTKITGGPRTVTFATAGQGGYWEGFIKGAKAGWKGVNPQGLSTQYDLGNAPAFNIKGNFAEKTMAYLERAMGATLRGFDHAAYNRAKNQTLGELATLRSLNTTGKADAATVQRFMKEAEDNLLNIADQYGRYVTFQDDNIISNTLVAVKRALNAKQDFGVGDLILKYPKTPGALIARGLEYSPAGFLRAAYQLAKTKGLLKGTPDIRETTLALSRAITGTAGLTGLGYFLVDKGVLTGSVDKDPDVRALQQQVGEGPYRVNVSALIRWARNGFNPIEAQPRENDLIVNYDWAQPVALAISAGANIAQSIKDRATAEDAAKGLGATLAGSFEGAVNTVAEQPVLQGLTRIVQGYDIGQSLTNAAKNVPSSFAPTLGNQVRQFSDNTSRSTYSPSPAGEAINRVKLKIPFVAGKLPPNYTTLGQTKETYQGGSNNLFNVFLNPSFVSRYKLTPEARLAVETFKETGETKQIPRVAPKKFIVSGKSFVLTPQEYSEFQRITGEKTRQGFSRIPGNLSSEKKIDRMTDILTEAGREGKEEILAKRGIKTKKKGNGLTIR